MKRSLRVVLSKVLALVLVVCAFAGCIYLVNGQDTVPRENPITQSVEVPRVPLAEAATTQVDQDILDLESTVTDASYADYEGDGLTQTSGTKEGVVGGSQFQLPEDETYFSMDILNYQEPYLPSDPRCYFQMFHMVPNLKAVDMKIFINGREVHYSGGVYAESWITLTDRRNELSAEVFYEKPDGETFSVKGKANPPMVEMYDPATSIQLDYKIPDYTNAPEIRFSVSVAKGPADADISVTQGGKPLRMEDGEYVSYRLNPGKENYITVSATTGAADWLPYEPVTWPVEYEKSEIGLDTNLGDYTAGTVYADSLTFYAFAMDPETHEHVENARITVKSDRHTGLLWPTDGSLRYGSDAITIPLARGYNQIVITVEGLDKNGNVTKTLSYPFPVAASYGEERDRLLLNAHIGGSSLPEMFAEGAGESDQNPEGGPNIATRVCGETILVNDLVSILQMTPTITEYDTGHTYYVGVHKIFVTLNGVPVPMWQEFMPEKWYRLFLNGGNNTLHIRVISDNLQYFDSVYNVYCDPNHVDPEGQIYISVNAGELGLGTIASGYVDIYSGQPLSYAVLDLLAQCGCEAVYRGETSYAMYLEAVIKPGLMAGWTPERISPELLQVIDEMQIWNGTIYENSLGERDVTERSGWVFTLNGVGIPGLSNTFPKSGDVCVANFTLTG